MAFNKQHIQSLMTELERLKSQYLDIQFIASVETARRVQHEANLITSKKEVYVLNLRLRELESILSSKMTKIHTLESEFSSKTLEMQNYEANFRQSHLSYRLSKHVQAICI
jgi:hypothetical protein